MSTKELIQGSADGEITLTVQSKMKADEALATAYQAGQNEIIDELNEIIDESLKLILFQKALARMKKQNRDGY